MISNQFAYHMARLLFKDVADPFTNWELAPLTEDATNILADTAYDPAWEAFAPVSIGGWTEVAYVAPGDPPPPVELLPDAYLTSPPSEWTNTSGSDIVVRTLAIIAFDSSLTTPARGLLFWEVVDPVVTVANTETFRVSELRFKIAELGEERLKTKD